MAQLVEQLIRNQQVAGSSPATSSMKKDRFQTVFFCFFTDSLLTFRKKCAII